MTSQRKRRLYPVLASRVVADCSQLTHTMQADENRDLRPSAQRGEYVNKRWLVASIVSPAALVGLGVVGAEAVLLSRRLGLNPHPRRNRGRSCCLRLHERP